VVEFDHDGAGLKLFNFAGSVFRAIDIMQTDDTPTTYVPPSLRSPGLSVAHVDRAERVYKSLLRSTAIQAESLGGAPILYAEDITQGYYIHAYSPLHGKWHSLAARNGTYTFLNSGATFDFADEAAINLAATSDPRVPLSSPTTPDGTSNDMRIPQTLFHWTGWSLAAPHPGTQLLEDDTVGIPANTPDPSGFQLTTAFTPQPGTLPLMRYGQSYQFRARAVDLAGNSIPFGDPSQSDPHASEPVTFGRFEPVSQPAVLMVAARTEGESVERLVIRSNYNVPSGADDERHIAPPKTAQQMAELHGAFDTALGLDPTGALYNQIVALADGSYADPAVGPVPDPNTPPMEGSPVSFYYPTTSLPLPYLPDVVARGAAFLDLPGTPAGSVFQVPFIPSGQSWPNYVPFRLAVAEGSGAPVYTPNGPNEGLLTVFLPKGVTAPVQISSYLNAARWASGYGPPRAWTRRLSPPCRPVPSWASCGPSPRSANWFSSTLSASHWSQRSSARTSRP
jgi:hypothetical protein